MERRQSHVPCFCQICKGKSVTRYTRRKHAQTYASIATSSTTADSQKDDAVTAPLPRKLARIDVADEEVGLDTNEEVGKTNQLHNSFLHGFHRLAV